MYRHVAVYFGTVFGLLILATQAFPGFYRDHGHDPETTVYPTMAKATIANGIFPSKRAELLFNLPGPQPSSASYSTSNPTSYPTSNPTSRPRIIPSSFPLHDNDYGDSYASLASLADHDLDLDSLLDLDLDFACSDLATASNLSSYRDPETPDYFHLGRNPDDSQTGTSNAYFYFIHHVTTETLLFLHGRELYLGPPFITGAKITEIDRDQRAGWAIEQAKLQGNVDCAVILAPDFWRDPAVISYPEELEERIRREIPEVRFVIRRLYPNDGRPETFRAARGSWRVDRVDDPWWAPR